METDIEKFITLELEEYALKLSEEAIKIIPGHTPAHRVFQKKVKELVYNSFLEGAIISKVKFEEARDACIN